MQVTKIRHREAHCSFLIAQSRRRHRGLSLVETLISLAITAMLLTATMVAIDASFHAYAVAAESASTQTSTRLVTHRLLSLLRTSTAHGPLAPDASPSFDPGIVALFPPPADPGDPPAITLSGADLTSHYVELVDASNNLVRVEYVASERMLYVVVTPLDGGAVTVEPLLSGVAACEFHVRRRRDKSGVWVLERASMDMSVEADRDTSLPMESANTLPIRVIASTMPRKLE